MFRRTALTLSALAAVMTGAAAPAPKAGAPAPVAAKPGGANDADLKCMLIASVLSQNQDPKARNMSSLMVFYYLGRIDARTPGINLANALKTEAQSVKPTEMQAEGQRCVNSINARAQVLQAMGPPPGSAPPAAAPGATAPMAPSPTSPH